MVLISGTPIGGRIPIPFTIPKIPVGFFFEIPISGESENQNSDLRFSEFWQFLAQELSTSFCCSFVLTPKHVQLFNLIGP